jgi:hypothetical protein
MNANTAMSRRPLVLAAAALGFGSSFGCDDAGKRSEAAAAEGVDIIGPLVDRDVAQVRKGLPEAAKALGGRMPDDPIGSRQELQDAIKAARAATEDMTFAKVTFFVFVSPEGVVLRSEIDPDRLVDQNLVKAFPDLTKVTAPGGGTVEVFGEMEQLRGVKRGADVAWVLGHPVAGADGKVRGMLATGWSMRLYARVLEQQLRAKLTEIAAAKEQKAAPLAYAFVLKGKGAYGDPEVSDSLAEELVKLDLAAKAAQADVKLQKEIDKRVFGIAAKRAPALGDDAAVAVIASVF